MTVLPDIWYTGRFTFSRAHMHERILGPHRGYFAVVAALVGGDLGNEYFGHGKAYTRLPCGFLDSGALLDVQCPALAPTSHEALDCAEDLLFEQIEALPEVPSVSPEGPLWCLAYVSRTSRMLTADEIQRLLAAARLRNARLGITGVLLYFDECFMQYIEGPRHGLELVYRKIRQDPLHFGLIKLLRHEVGARVFPQWSMAFDSPIAPLWTTAHAAVTPVGAPAPAADTHGNAIKNMLGQFVGRTSAREEMVQAISRGASP
jgi:hypothetical protein